MKAAIPLTRALFELGCAGSSRIPHLRQHILAGQRTIGTKTAPVHVFSQSRCQHTPSAPIDTDIFEGGPSQTSAELPPSDNGQYDQSTLQSTQSIVDDLLEDAQPDRLLFFLQTPDGHDFIRRADSASFTRAFQAIDPGFFVEPFKVVNRYTKPSLFTQPTYRWVRSIEERFESFILQLDTILNIRIEAGHTLNLDVYRHLLDCARRMGDRRLARSTFLESMRKGGIEPDLDCYNHFMEAHCWNCAFSKAEQWQLRVTPRKLALRTVYRRPDAMQGHRVGGHGGLRHWMLTDFRNLTTQGLKGDEATFTNLIIAMGREADMNGVKSILKSVYNVDVDLLQDADEEEIESPTFYPEEHPLRPTSRLLYTVAHTFGSNNDAYSAIQLVDYLSRQYVLDVPFSVWGELFEWTFVLQLRRSGAGLNEGKGIGQVPHALLENLWTAMTDTPHNIKPDVPMLTVKARALRGIHDFASSMELLRQANDILESERRRLADVCETLINEVGGWLRQGPGAPLPRECYEVRREFVLLSLQVDRDMQLILVALRGVFKHGRWAEHAPVALREQKETAGGRAKFRTWYGQYRQRLSEWERRTLPSLLEEFQGYLPNTLVYNIKRGFVALIGKAHRGRALQEQWSGQSRKVGMMRAAVDVDGYDQMVEGMRGLPKLMAEAEVFCRHCNTHGHRADDHTEEFCCLCHTLGHGEDDCPNVGTEAGVEEPLNTDYSSGRPVESWELRTETWQEAPNDAIRRDRSTKRDSDEGHAAFLKEHLVSDAARENTK